MPGEPLISSQEIERDEGLVPKCIASAMGQGQPLTHEAFARLQGGEEPLGVPCHPGGPEPPGLIGGVGGEAALPAERHDRVSQACGGHTGAVELLEHHDMILGVASTLGADPGMAVREVPIRGPGA
jgi:hypothetical protein